ncbi:MAG: hypothetical protein Ct9H90mP24_3040 [Methanobacteriota archaeon]|nr:MAG: hypothetical protein Ct9H90mP24_3040 [Euryarchaeota archaeon]
MKATDSKGNAREEPISITIEPRRGLTSEWPKRHFLMMLGLEVV